MPEESFIRPIMLPPEVVADLTALIRYRDQVSTILEAAREIPPAASIRGFTWRVAQKGEVDASVALDVLHTLVNIRRMQRAREVDAARMVGILTASLEKYTPDEWQTEYLTKWQAASEDIVRAVESIDEDHPLFVSEKAETLAYSHQNILSSQRIITDVRPVFDKEGAKIQETIVLHTLFVEYFDGVSSPKRIALTLDSADIAELRRLCERAQGKAKATLDALRSLNPVELPEELHERS
jgi:hypothetical protein